MKSSKSDGARDSQMNGAAAPREAGPLFPRLHVRETEKAGPRAPPRNKMALFEQFTVPSHRFVQPQPSPTSTALSNQPQQFDYRHPYYAYYTPSVPYSNAHPQPSHGVSSCVTSSISESQRASGSQTSENYSFSRAKTKENGSINLSSLLEEKAKVVSDDILMQSSPRAHVKTQGALYSSSVLENICDRFASASAESAEMPITTTTKNYLLEAMSIVACPVVESQGCGHDKAELNKSMEVTDAIQTKRVTRADAANEHCPGCLSFASEQSCQQSDVDCDKMLSEDSSHVNDLAEAASNTDLKNNGCMEDQSSSPSGNCLAASAQTSTRDAIASADGLLKDKDENMGDSQNNMGSNVVSELSQQGTGRDTDDSPSSVLGVQAIGPKDVIRAVGQQQFWKARKALLRQQRIFSDQVFQLHKLIKVQQLLAETPGTLLDEEMPFDTVNHCAGPPSLCNAVERENEKAHVTSSLNEQGSKDQGNKTGNQPESIQGPQWYAAVGNDGMGSIPYLPAFTPSGVSAWGYPSLGMGQWMGALPAQGRSSAYQPFAGAFSPGAPFGGLYGPAGLGPVPFGIPYTGERSEPWEETSSNHGPPVAIGPNSTPANGHVAHDLPGAWQFVRYNYPHYNQRFYAGVPEKNTSTGSGASINHQRPVNPLHASGTEHILGEASLNNNGLENSIQRSENSCPSDTSGFKFKSSAYTPRKPGSYHQKTEQPAQMSTSSVFRAFSSVKQHKANGTGGREEAHKVEVRLPKRQQSDQVPINNENAEETTGRPSDQSENALDLFPLVPSLSSDGGQSSSKQISTMWQGGVIKAIPHSAVAASQSAAGILLSLQRERRQ